MPTLLFPPGTNPPIVPTHPRNATGWGAVESAVREDDERLVNDCKDDINTLLTFAGLYSAALTALLALSFGMLQQDVASESLQVLQQISQQTATYQILLNGMSGVLNTSAVLPSPPPSTPFQPTDEAIRVNVLWFASLVLSLATASIGILVKQWLRAYTTYSTSSAQGRMRTRHFRHEGLEIWKVFEIAAALPYLIQLALGLFFVGLCYFTAEVDPRLGHTTLPLVAAWAFFLLMTSLFPVFSSQCPYKAASFEGTLSLIRRGLFSALATASSMTPPLKAWAKKHLPKPDSKYLKPYNPVDEAHAAKHPGNDSRVLGWADAFQADDELFGTGILAALKQSQPDVEGAVNFILHAISNRTQAKEISIHEKPILLDCSSFTPQAHAVIVEILLSQTISDPLVQFLEADSQPESTNLAMEWTICILFSVPIQALPPNGVRFLERCLRMGKIARTLTTGCTFEYNGSTLKASLRALQRRYPLHNVDLATVLKLIKLTLEYYFDRAKLPEPDQAAAISPSDRQDKPEEWHKFLNTSSLTETVTYLAEVHGRHLQVMPARSSAPEQQELFDSAYGLIFRLSATIHIGDLNDISNDLRRALANVSRDCGAKQDEEVLKSMLQAMIVQPPIFLWWSHHWVLAFRDSLDLKGLEVFQSAIRGIIQTMNDMSLECAINLSYAAGYALYMGTSDIKDENVFRLWRSIFEDLGQLLQDVIARQGNTDLSGDSVNVLNSQIYWMDNMDTGKYESERDRGGDAAYMDWSQTFEPEHSVFNDRFVSAMAKLYPKSRRRNCDWRIRRLEDMQKQEGQAKNGKRAGEGTATADENDEGGSSGAKKPIDDEVRLASSEPGRSGSVVHLQSDGGGPSGDSAMASEFRNEKEAGEVTATADEDEGEDDINGATPRLPIADEHGSMSSEPKQSEVHPHLDEGSPGDSTLTSEAENGKKSVGGTTPGLAEGGDDYGPFIQDKRTSTSGEPERSANVPSHSDEGSDGHDGDVAVASEVETRNGEKAVGGSTIVDVDDEDDTAGVNKPITDERSLTLSEPGLSTIPSHPDEGEPDEDLKSVAAGEVKHDKKPDGRTKRAADDNDEDNNEAARQTTAGEPSRLMSGSEQEQSASPTHSHEGGPVVDPVVARVGSSNEDAASSEGGSAGQVQPGG